jgi:hypothetical protein
VYVYFIVISTGTTTADASIRGQRFIRFRDSYGQRLRRARGFPRDVDSKVLAGKANLTLDTVTDTASSTKTRYTHTN